LNKGKVYMSYAGNLNKGEIITGGITGIAENSKLLNVGNEGAVESNGSKVLYAAGIIGNVGRQVTVANAYNKGKIYGTSPDKNAELYIAGLVEGIAIVDNFYNTGSVKLKAGNMKEIDGDIFSNIRPGENTKTFNHSYWVDGTSPYSPVIPPASILPSIFASIVPVFVIFERRAIFPRLEPTIPPNAV
jgi:hypothetical protein